MSYSSLYFVNNDGTLYTLQEFPNAFTFAPKIWRYLEDKYLPPYIQSYVKEYCWYREGITKEELDSHNINYSRLFKVDSNSNAIQQIWDLVDDDRLSFEEKVLLCCTFDYAVVDRKDIYQLIDIFNSNSIEFPILKHMSDSLISFLDKKIQFKSICFSCTSVGSWIDSCYRNYPYFNDDEIDCEQNIKYASQECWSIFDELRKSE